MLRSVLGPIKSMIIIKHKYFSVLNPPVQNVTGWAVPLEPHRLNAAREWQTPRYYRHSLA